MGAGKTTMIKHVMGFLAYWDELRRRRYERQIGIGMFDPKYAMSPRDEGVPSWDSLSGKAKDEADLRRLRPRAVADQRSKLFNVP